MRTLELYAEELRERGEIWITEDVTADFMMYLGIETEIEYMIAYDTLQPEKRVQFINSQYIPTYKCELEALAV